MKNSKGELKLENFIGIFVGKLKDVSSCIQWVNLLQNWKI